MSHACHAAPPPFWLRLEWRMLVRIERWVFSHHRRGPVLKQFVTMLDHIYDRQKHGTDMTSYPCGGHGAASHGQSGARP